eukprot:scaffold8718_cov159-Isochrysis_galbana.AAC.8
MSCDDAVAMTHIVQNNTVTAHHHRSGWGYFETWKRLEAEAAQDHAAAEADEERDCEGGDEA